MGGISLFNFSQEEMLSFFAVLTRFSVLIAVLPFVGDRMVPTTVKILLSLAITIALFPALVASGRVNPAQAAIWGATAGGIVGTIALEVLCALALGFTAKLAFQTIEFGGNLIGTFMGFSMASEYDASQESQTQLIAKIQMAIAMLLFLAVDGHHLMLRASLESYQWVGIGGLAGLFGHGGLASGALSQKMIELTGNVIKFGVELSGPVAVSMFAVNIVFAVLAKAMPQLNILILSFAVTALIGIVVMLLTMPEFVGAVSNLFSYIDGWMISVLQALAKGR